MHNGNLAYADDRIADRDPVHHRTRATLADGRSVPLLVVNVSPHGLMARCEAVLEPGDTVRVLLPLAGMVSGEVRWALGGRIGCQFARPVPLATYYEMLAALGT